MNTQEIIDEINKMTLSGSEDYNNLERIDELTTQLRNNQDGYLASETLIYLLERHPDIEFGNP
jgi:hypothetical protein